MTFVNWNRNYVSAVCGVTCCIFAHHLPYHNKWIWCKLRQALDIFLQILRFCMLSIKFNYAAPFNSLKLLQGWFHPLAKSFDPLATFLILWNVKHGFCFATSFHCYSLIPHIDFCSVSHRRCFYPRYRHDQSHCVHLKVLKVGSFLLLLSLLKYFLFQTGSFLLPLSLLKYFLFQT